MKLLGWMHNKLWRSGIESVKDFAIANPCMCLSALTVDDENMYSENVQLQLSFGVEANNVSEKCANFSNSSDFFHGFLTIGTLGSEPATPTFSEKVTEDDLKLINYELEKFLEAETKEDGCDQPPGTTSRDNIIALAGKHTTEAEEENDGTSLTCPLRGYLFGSTIELPNKMIDMRKEKPLSAKLSQRAIMVSERSKMDIEKKDVLIKHSNKFALNFVKRMLKKLYTSSLESSTFDSNDSYSTKKKLEKVVSRFHRKIHPESSTATNECQKSQKYMIENAFFVDNFNNGRMMNEAEDRIPSCQEFMSKDWKTSLGFPLYGVDTNVSSAKKGHWIKTDAEYLVLEL